ncbi:MAG: hypothetical protein DI598_02795 [Pseudopedobacter saltans]|uniref:DUF554 domain-containing protein n=1 Tax=Pseudopedobacter saltans TaxID=151895 RepID=A0A2W5H837_9SPHI|nr:MAG: hypothetical protein DI598_02795 [Pseudopedobacter saltans]
MPTGPIIDCVATLVGGILGTLLGNKIPERVRRTLPLTFGAASMAMGIFTIVKMHSLPPVILALIVGSIIGELLMIENAIGKAANSLKNPIQKLFPNGSKIEDEALFLEQFVSVLVLFSASGTGIFGALQEGISHNPTILISKGFLDFFTATIFATSLGAIVSITVVPQAIILFGLYFLAQIILPLTTPNLIADFSACGGIIMFVTGMRICGIKTFPIANMLPALVLVMIISHYWAMFFG